MRKPGIVVLGVLLMLAAAGAVRAQCAKRILVYLDTSGSMWKKTQDGQTPFEKTIQALQSLDERFIGPEDVVRIATFGQTITPNPQAKGLSETRTLLQKLRSAGKVNDTNFAAVFADIEQNLSGTTAYDSQVVLIASDFVHDPSDTLYKLDPNLASWTSLFDQSREKVKNRFSAGSRSPLVLFVAEALDWGPDAQRQALASFDFVPSRQILRVGETNREQLAAAIQNALLFPLEVTAGLKPGDIENLQIRVSNTSCVSLDLDKVAVICPNAGAPISVTIEAGQRQLGRRGRNGSQTLEISRDSIPCDTGAQKEYDVVAETRQGAVGRAKASTRTRLSYEVESVLFEEHLLFGSVMHLIVKLKGIYADDHRTYAFSVTGSGGGTAISGTFAAPAKGLPKPDEKPRSYRITIPVTKAQRTEAMEAGEVHVQINDADPLGNDKSKVKAGEDKMQSLTNLVQLIGSIAMPFAFSFALLYRRFKVRDAMGAAQDWNNLIQFGWAILLGALALLNWALRAVLIGLVPLTVANSIKVMSIFLVVFFGIALSWRALGQARLVRDVFGGKMDDTGIYERRVRAGRKPWVFGALLAAIVLAGVYFFAPKSDAGPIAEITALDVAAD